MTDPIAVSDAYQRWAASYDTDRNTTRDLDAAVLRATPLPLDGARVVEFGAGTGKNTAYLASRAAAVTELDLSVAMLAKARQRLGAAPHVRFVHHHIRQPWPVKDDSADLVIGNFVLEHVADVAPVFAAARRAMRLGGLLVLSELHPYRQLGGAGAHFSDVAGAERRVEAYHHTTGEFVMAALATGFALVGLAEPGDPIEGGSEPVRPTVPRLLQLILQAAARRPVASHSDPVI